MRDRFLETIEQRSYRVIHRAAQGLFGVLPHGSDFVIGKVDPEIFCTRDPGGG